MFERSQVTSMYARLGHDVVAQAQVVARLVLHVRVGAGHAAGARADLPVVGVDAPVRRDERLLVDVHGR